MIQAKYKNKGNTQKKEKKEKKGKKERKILKYFCSKSYWCHDYLQNPISCLNVGVGVGVGENNSPS